MAARSDSHSQDSTRRKHSVEKLRELSSRLGESRGSIEGGRASAGAGGVSAGDLAAHLFSKAPHEFLEQKTLADLERITARSQALLSRVVGEPRTVIVEAESQSEYCALHIITGDRPFIVNSITETLQSLGAQIRVLLHPIILIDNYRTSVSYVEIENVDEPRMQALVSQLKAGLADLVVVTEDFTSMLVRCETLAKVLENPTYRTRFTQSEKREVADFLRWLTDGGFIFLGYLEWRANADGNLPEQPATQLGMARTAGPLRAEIFAESREDCQRSLEAIEPITISKLRTESTVHRRMRMTNIVVPEISTEGRVVALHSIFGLLTSRALAQEASSIPVVRRKLQKLIEVEEVVHNSHDYKYIVDIIDSMPKEEALRLDLEALREIVRTIIGIQNRNETRVAVRFDNARRGVSVLVVMPRQRFNTYVRNKIQQYVEQLLGAPSGSSEYHLDLGNKPLARFHFYIPVRNLDLQTIDLARLEATINGFSRTWQENLEARLSGPDKKEWRERYTAAFPEQYQALNSVEDGLRDIEVIAALTAEHPVVVRIVPSPDSKAPAILSFYKLGAEISISQAFPILENAGLEVLNEQSFAISPQPTAQEGATVFVHRFSVRAKSGKPFVREQTNAVLCPGLEQVFLARAENDPLNSLMLDAQLDVRAISLLRVYCSLLWQVNKSATRGVILEALATAPAASVEFWKMFQVRFDPALDLPLEARQREFAKGMSHFMDLLRDVSDITKDRVLRSLSILLENSVRTNFYANHSTIAIKIQSENAEIMPIPRPKFEIFVNSPLVEGVHLRSAMIARGGLRWSDRNEDYRSEVLGLMKTQKIKNAVIVPSGAKGGFIVRQLPKEPEQIPAAVEQAYREFIRALLSVTDNVVDGAVIHPPVTIIYDGEDPYFVVAADKGTATFSDIANAVAVKEYNFWLGDAFASGGSRGYDHKKFGITAKGAWECVKRHFHDLGVDYINKPFSVVGIGDMAGDVFGNGMILSRQIKLLAAFNHKHVFIDPNPDPERSFAERQRLFALPQSQWSDYDAKLISPGGGVFLRFDKSITLSVEARAALGLGDEVPPTVTGEQLITMILRAPVDLLWNGGIGTYVKAESEAHSDVNDGTNDRVRVNAGELRARVVGEGGNLGFTQRARIEFAEGGGRVNTDAIDNSAGVDLSDHEVNIKILCAALMREGKLVLEERDRLLAAISPSVVEAVLEHNKNHALLLDIAVKRSGKSIVYYKSLIRELHKMGFIHRTLESLPDDDDLNDRALRKRALFAPELAVCLAGVKMWTKEVVLNSPLTRDPRLENYLLEYFPQELQKRFREEILQHALARNIVASQVSNNLIDAVGITFLHRMCITYSTRPITVMKCLLASELLLKTKLIRKALARFDNLNDNSIFLTLRQGIGKTLRDATTWLISCHGETLQLDEMVKLYESAYSTLVKHASEVYPSGAQRQAYQERLDYYTKLQLDDFSARSLAVFPDIIAIFEMLWAAKKSGKNVRAVATVYTQVIEELGIAPILKLGDTVDTRDKWEHENQMSAFEEIRRSVSLITCTLLKKGAANRQEVAQLVRESRSFEQLANTVEEIKSGALSVAALSVLAKHLRVYQLP